MLRATDARQLPQEARPPGGAVDRARAMPRRGRTLVQAGPGLKRTAHVPPRTPRAAASCTAASTRPVERGSEQPLGAAASGCRGDLLEQKRRGISPLEVHGMTQYHGRTMPEPRSATVTAILAQDKLNLSPRPNPWLKRPSGSCQRRAGRRHDRRARKSPPCTEQCVLAQRPGDRRSAGDGGSSKLCAGRGVTVDHDLAVICGPSSRAVDHSRRAVRRSAGSSRDPGAGLSPRLGRAAEEKGGHGKCTDQMAERVEVILRPGFQSREVDPDAASFSQADGDSAIRRAGRPDSMPGSDGGQLAGGTQIQRRAAPPRAVETIGPRTTARATPAGAPQPASRARRRLARTRVARPRR